jgi:hypothetical protein
MHEIEGNTQIFRLLPPSKNIIILSCILYMLMTFVLFKDNDWVSALDRTKFLMIWALGHFMFWITAKPYFQNAVVLRIGSDGVSSYYLQNSPINWIELSDIKINLRQGSGMQSSCCMVTLTPNKNSPSWLAIQRKFQRKWIFWNRNSIRISLGSLSIDEQVLSVFTLLSAWARYGNERATQLARGVRRFEAEQAVKDLGLREGSLQDIIKRADSFFPPRG